MKTSAAPYPDRRNPIVVYSSIWPLQFGHHSFWTFCQAVLQPGDAHTSTFQQICNHSRTCRTSTLEDAFFTEWIDASSFEVILARQSSHVPTWTSASRTSGSRCIFHTLLRRRSCGRIRLCRFCTLIFIVSETAIVSFHTLPVGFPLPTISKNSLYTLFCSLILDHGVCLIISISGPKFLFRKSCSILLFTIVFNL